MPACAARKSAARRSPGADRTRLALCALLLAAGVFAELTAVPKLLQLGLAAIT